MCFGWWAMGPLWWLPRPPRSVILVHKSNEDKVMVLDSHKLLGASSEADDRFVHRSDSYDFVLVLIMMKFIAFLC